jgi:hypothetical protein
MRLCRIIYCSVIALRLLSDIIAHYQEHVNCNYSFWFIHVCHRLLPTTIHVNVSPVLSTGLTLIESDVTRCCINTI